MIVLRHLVGYRYRYQYIDCDNQTLKHSLNIDQAGGKNNTAVVTIQN